MCDPRGGTGDSSEAKDGCNECDDQECERPTEHDLPFCFLGIALRTGTGRMARRILERSDQKVLRGRVVSRLFGASI